MPDLNTDQSRGQVQNLPSASSGPRAIEPVVVPETELPPATGAQRIFWIIIAILCAGWIFIPNFFIIPIPFFIDEGIAAIILMTALSKLGIRIPILHWFFEKRMGKSIALKTKR
ncbi:MAG TPA: hypothetical protein PKE49_02690 [Leptospiraceae bacterium]|jgi:hypothetical protein|nr:hypothetical protein [Leptospirales bacterium]HMW59662.1 hypothetical protein [Leptospiraceae bacterium]HMX55400.1 hypothetical protein [Leptospiraceae bacterium]HMY47132.1 hypothetical protein [Leptospiraceae bacterium]HMZ38566.1 hypothetical protein [Leptospiraceae bacterium]